MITYINAETLEMGDIWTGATSSAWEDLTYWSCGNEPDSNTAVIFNAGAAIINSNITIRSLRMYPTAQITLNQAYLFYNSSLNFPVNRKVTTAYFLALLDLQPAANIFKNLLIGWDVFPRQNLGVILWVRLFLLHGLCQKINCPSILL